MRLSEREIATIRAALRLWRSHLKTTGNPSSKSDLFERHLPLSPREIDQLGDRLAKVREAPHMAGDWSPQCARIPTYYGHRETRPPNQKEFDEPYAPVLIGEADGLRLILGTDNPGDDEKPDIHLERRPHGWAFFIHPNAGDPVAMLYLLDDGRTFLLPEPYTQPPIERVHETPRDLDAL